MDTEEWLVSRVHNFLANWISFQSQSSLDDPYMVDMSNDQRKAAVAILEAILEAMTNDEMKTSQVN